MKITSNNLFRKESAIYCPHCHSKAVWKHGTYIRKWFHECGDRHPSTLVVQRYQCCEKHCPRKTFTVQAADALPFCRFLADDLCTMARHLEFMTSVHHLSQLTALSRPVLKRVRVLLHRTGMFLAGLCREISDGATAASSLRQSLQIALSAYSWIELKSLWYRHLYQHWSPANNTPHKISPLL